MFDSSFYFVISWHVILISVSYLFVILKFECLFSKSIAFFFRLIVVCMLNFFEFLFRWISSYFVEKKIASWRRNHVVKISCNFSKVLQFFSVFVLYVSTFTSSTNSMTVVFLLDCSHTSSRFALKNKYNIGETGNFCETPAFTLLIVLVFSSKIIEVDCQRSVDCFHAEDERDFLHSICPSVYFLSMCSRFI